MSRILLWPFYSQQDKRTGKFLIDRDSGAKMYSAIAHELMSGHHWMHFAVPHESQCQGQLDTHCANILRLPPMPLSNLERKLHWDADFIRSLKPYAFDLIVTTHEFIPIPLRNLLDSDTAIVVEGILQTAHEMATSALYIMAQEVSDAVHCSNKVVAEKCSGQKQFVWTFGYDHSYLRGRDNKVRMFDVLFNSRCSSTGYTNHRHFCDTFEKSNFNIVCTDPTGYGAESGSVPKKWLIGNLDEVGYKRVLGMSKVVVHLSESGYVGTSFYEAIAAGCTPVVPYAREYVDILGEQWPYYLRPGRTLREEVEIAMQQPVQVSLACIEHASYITAARQAVRDLRELC